MIQPTRNLIDSRLQEKQDAGFRRHLGASVIGKPCARQGWYIFRWAKAAWFKGRILRLFQRGHEEEIRLIKFLRQAGIHVADLDPNTGEQWRIADHNDHFGGSFDSKLYDTPEFPMLEILGEYKTHNRKRFKALKTQGIRRGYYEHFVQMQIYMHYGTLPAALYFAVNKDDDDMEVIPILYDSAEAEKHIDKAGKIIGSPVPLPRMANASPGWYQCKWCNYLQICHYHETKAMNCRTCVYSAPIKDGAWWCTGFNCQLSLHDQRRGCLQYKEIQEE